MTVVWGAAVILEKFFGNIHIVHPQNIEGNGRIVIDKGRNKIFSCVPLHYNDTCKINQLSILYFQALWKTVFVKGGILCITKQVIFWKPRTAIR